LFLAEYIHFGLDCFSVTQLQHIEGNMSKPMDKPQENDGYDMYDDDEDKAIEKKRDITFTVDPDIYEKCGVKKPMKNQELEGSDAEKLYRFQLAQDIETINRETGTFKSKVRVHQEKREEDIVYKILSETKHLGSFGRYCEVSDVTREISWRNTSTLRGEIYKTHLMKAPLIAQKRYVEWMTGKPQGPSKEFLRDKAQRKADSELWEDIKYYRLDKTRTELREEAKESSRQRALARIKEAEELKKSFKKKGDAAKEDDEAQQSVIIATKKANIKDNNFSKNRLVPTLQEATGGMHHWDQGHNNNWNYDIDSFGKYVKAITTGDGSRLSSSTSKFDMEKLYEGPSFTAENYIKQGDEIAVEFFAYIVETNLKKAEYFVSIQKAKAKKQAKIDAKLKAQEALNMRRKNNVDSAQMQIDAIMAKTVVRLQGVNAAKQEGSSEVNAEHVDSDEDEEEGEKIDYDDDDSVSLTTAQETVTLEQGSSVTGRSRAPTSLEMKKVPTCTQATVACLKIALNPWVITKNVRKVYKKITRTIRRKYARYLYYKEPKNRAKLKKYIFGLRCIFGPKKKAKKISPEENSSLEDTSLVSDFVEIEAAKSKKLREWEKYTDEELDKMDANDRKRLKKMRKKDEAEDAIKEREANEAKITELVKKAKEEKEAIRRQQGNWLQRFAGKITQYFTGEIPEYNLTLQEKKKRQAEKDAARLLKDEEDNEQAMETLFAFRERQRQAADLYADVIKALTGIDTGNAVVEYNVDELIRVCRLGQYNNVIDIVDHHMNPIHPNAANSEGESAFYTVLIMIMNNEAAESNDNEDRSVIQKLTACLRNKVKAGKLDIVLKILAYKGGDVNFLKKDKDVDGTAVLHEAAQAGATNMIGWLAQRGAKFGIKTSQLKRTPLMYACRANQLNAVLYLLKKGSMLSINAQDVNGWTALHFAAAFASPDLASVLMICGADVYMRTTKGGQAVDEASTRQRQVMVETIRCFKQPDLLHKRLLNFFEIKYFAKAKEEVPDALSDDGEDDGGYGNGGPPEDAPAGAEVGEAAPAEGGGEEAALAEA